MAIRKPGFTLVALVILLAAGSVCRADLIVSSMLPVFSPAVSSIVDFDTWCAVEFTTDSRTYDHIEITVRLLDAVDNTSPLVVSIYDNHVDGPDDDPGSVLFTLSGTASPASAGDYIYTAPIDQVLAPDTTYHLALTTSGTASYRWVNTFVFSSFVVTGPGSAPEERESSVDFGATWTSLTTAGGQLFQVDGTVVPEPSTCALLAVGLGTLLAGLRRRA